jgi:hypothetical protein
VSPDMATSSLPVVAGPMSGLTDSLLIAGVAEITGMIARRNCMTGLTRPTCCPSSGRRPRLAGAPGARRTAARIGGAVARRAGQRRARPAVRPGQVTKFLRDPQVENVDINGCDQVWITYASGERVAGPPVAATDDARCNVVITGGVDCGKTTFRLTRGWTTFRLTRGRAMRPRSAVA